MKTLHERIIGLCKIFTNGATYKQIYHGLNNNSDYEKTRQRDLRDALAIMCEGKLLYRTTNGHYITHEPNKGVVIIGN